MENTKVRLDKYLWSIRLFKTRAMAAEACDKNKVSFNGKPVKASRMVKIGDEYDIKTADKKWVIRVTALLDHRVAYAEAVKHYLDLTPADANPEKKFQSPAFYTGKRMSKTGKPTRKQQQELDEFLDQWSDPEA